MAKYIGATDAEGDAAVAAGLAHARAQMGAAAPKVTPPTSSKTVEEKSVASSGTSGDAFIDQLKKTLLSSSKIISSEDTNMDKKISAAIAGINKSNEASKGAINSQYNRLVSEAKGAGESAVVSKLEQRSGFATVNAVIQRTAESAAKNVKDLEMRRTEALLSGDANAASQVSGMIMKELEMAQNARIQGFNSLLNLGNFAVNAMEAETKRRESMGESMIKASDVDTFVDTSGNVVAKNKITGETLWTAKGIGRAGSASPTNMIVNPIADESGYVAYTEVKNPKTGQVEYRDNTGKIVDPSKVKIEKGKDPFDILIDDIIGDIMSEGI